MTRTYETTDQGEQILVDGVRPITLSDRLAVMVAQPMRPKRNPMAPQKSCDHGLFDEVSRTQIDLVDLINQTKKEA